jgi:hypothetical protein
VEGRGFRQGKTVVVMMLTGVISRQDVGGSIRYMQERVHWRGRGYLQ